MLHKISIYTILGFLSPGVSFFLMPYLSHYIKPAEYGILSMINTYVTILIPLIGLVAASLIYVDYFKITDKKEFASLFSSIQIIPLVPAIFFLIINIIFPSTIAKLLAIPADKTYWLSISVVLSVFIIYEDTLIQYTITEQQPKLYALFNISKLVIEVALTVLFVAHYRLSWEGRLLSWLIANFIFFIVAFYYFHQRKLLTLKISKKYIWAGISFGLPLILHTLGKFVINQSDRVFIAKLVSIDEAGIYNIGYQVGMIMLVLVNAINNFITPFINEKLTQPTLQNKIAIVKTSYIMLGVVLLLLIIITLVSPLFFSLLIDKNYMNAEKYVFWTALSYSFWGIYIVFSGYIFYTKRIKFLAYLSVVNIVLNAVLNYVLIKHFGAIGAAYATCLSFFIVALFTVKRANELIPLPWISYLTNKVFKN